MTGVLPTFVLLATLAFHQGIMTYFLVLGGQYGMDYYHKYLDREKQSLRLELNTAQLKTQLAHAQLSALKMQLQPHFFIQYAERHHGVGSSTERQTGGGDAGAVGQYLQLYLSTEQVRFPDRLRTECSQRYL
jgi:hypothetical protein